MLMNIKLFCWVECVDRMTDESCQRLAEWRGYRIEFCKWLRDMKLVGIYNHEFAFPVYGPAGKVVGCHHGNSTGKWHYFPTGNTVSPLVVGDLATAKTVWPFESQWDAFALMDKLGWDTNEVQMGANAVIITRGAKNGKRIQGLIPATARVVVVMQNDPPEEDGSLPPADKWLKDVLAAVNRPAHVLRPPAEHKDLNDWTRAGASRAHILLAFVKAIQNGTGELGAAQVSEPKVCIAPKTTASARPFPTDALGPILALFVREVARVERVPESLVACYVLGVLSATLGKQLRVRLLSGKVTPANLYIFSAAPSGVGKSEVAKHCDVPLHNHQIRLVEDWKLNQLPGLLASKQMLIEQRRKLIRQAKASMADADECGLRDRLIDIEKMLIAIEDQLIEPRLLTEDVTTQKLGMLLRANDEQMCVLSRDSGDVINNLLGRNHKLDSPDDSLFLKGFSLESTTVDRVGRPSIQLVEPCLTVVLLTQPDKLVRLLKNSALRDGGLMPRFLIHCTEALPQYLDVAMPSFDPALKSEYTQLVDSLIRSYRCSTGVPIIVDATPEAKQAMVNCFNAGIDRRLQGVESMDSFTARHTEQACRIAVVLHAADHGADAGKHPVGVDCTNRAIAIAEWFAGEQLVLLAGVLSRSEEEMKEAVLALAQEEQYASSGIWPREVQRRRIVKHAGEGLDLLNQLVAEGRLEEMPRSLKGRGSPHYRLPAK